MRKRDNRGAAGGGFTLIELLIVVAIIAILAAIALPNFLEAQTRARVARVRADMRTMATAIEAYAVDYTSYPYTDNTFERLAERLARLTTPVAYITTFPADPFGREQGSSYGPGSALDPLGTNYLYNTGNNTTGTGVADPGTPMRQSWSLTSGGPDGTLDFPYWPFAEVFIVSNQYHKFIYDPTNGTTSKGDIFLRGGRPTRHIPAIDHR